MLLSVLIPETAEISIDLTRYLRGHVHYTSMRRGCWRVQFKRDLCARTLWPTPTSVHAMHAQLQGMRGLLTAAPNLWDRSSGNFSSNSGVLLRWECSHITGISELCLFVSYYHHFGVL